MICSTPRAALLFATTPTKVVVCVVPNISLKLYQGVCISGLSLFKPRDAVELIKLLEEGNANRTQHPTDANATSSRSHAVFTVYLHQKARTADVRSVSCQNVRLLAVTRALMD